MRVVFLYTSSGSAGVGSNPPWNPDTVSINHFVGEHGLPTEGYFYMLRKMKEAGVIDDLIVFIESNRYPGYKVIEGIKCYVIPRIENVEEYLVEGDIIFVRGGFRGWLDPFLIKMKAQKRWLLLYAANTGRQRWVIWDIVFSDLVTGYSFDKRGRFFHCFTKPVNPKIFFQTSVNRDIDVCVGASKIHDKKAQWKVINALIEYKRMFGNVPTCVMPGSMVRRGVETIPMEEKINMNGLNINRPGFVNRYELNHLYNRIKLFVYLANSGENDRSPLEATSVGCPTLLGGITRHAPFLGWYKQGIKISKDTDNSAVVADEIHTMLEDHTETLRDRVASHFDKHNGFDSVVMPEMTKLFNVIRENPKPNLECLKKEYGL